MGSVTTPVSGSGQSITTLIDAAIPAPRFPAVIGNYGYADVEAILQLVPGNIYYNVTNSCYRGYNGSIWGCITGQIFSIPVPITQGGTGSSTAAGALANLGAALFLALRGAVRLLGQTSATTTELLGQYAALMDGAGTAVSTWLLPQPESKTAHGK